MDPERILAMPRNTILPFPLTVNLPFSLECFVIQRQHLGLPDEAIYAPLCSRCHRPILDLSLANLVFFPSEEEEEDFIPIGEIDGFPLLHRPGEVRVYHLECDPGGKPWCRLTNVLKTDQRAMGKF
jgi:hypothetical protein